MELQAFRLNIKSTCDIKQRGWGDWKRYYILKKEQHELFDKLIENDENDGII
jgi:hypothetical protein